MGKWDEFEQDNPTEESASSDKKEELNDALELPEDTSTGPTKADKNKVVQDMVDLRDSVSGVLANARGKLPAERIQDLEDAQGTIDGAVGQISPKDALANQQEQTQSMGMGMGGGSRSDDEEE